MLNCFNLRPNSPALDKRWRLQSGGAASSKKKKKTSFVLTEQQLTFFSFKLPARDSSLTSLVAYHLEKKTFSLT